jgi:hypothetical protein
MSTEHCITGSNFRNKRVVNIVLLIFLDELGEAVLLSPLTR